MKIQNKRKNKK